MSFSFGQSGTKQMKTDRLLTFITKTKQMAFSFGQSGTKQMKTDRFLTIYY